MALGGLAALLRNRTTYRVGLLQAKAYRILKSRTNEALAELEEGVTSVHWALLGLLKDAGSSLRPSELAHSLGVEPAFITALVADLSLKKYVVSSQDPSDSRAKVIALTKSGEAFVDGTEPQLLLRMRPLLKGIQGESIGSYLGVLEAIAKNAETD